VAWPCGLLQSALVVAGLAASPAEGAGVMAAFAVASGVSLWLGPAMWLRLSGQAQAQRWAIRLAGAMLLAASGWALWHDLWLRFGPPICT
jgi:sulfite exporter TauE/SafE